MEKAGVAAATTLALIMVVAALGTIRQVDDAGAAHCATAPCPAQAAPAQAAAAAPPTTWEASLHVALDRAERGFLKMAGLAPGR